MTDDERAEQYQFATYDTRPPKSGHEDEGTLSGRWRTEATAAGWEAEHWLPGTLGQTREREALLSAEVARRDAADIALPPLPGHGLDAGPDLGL